MIAGGCAAPIPETDFLTSVLGYVDCQTQAIGIGGYGALAQPGSSLSLILSALLTLFVAFFGYRLILGQTPGVRDGVLALVKIGIVLALTASWPAYRTLVYDVAISGPAELAAEIAGPAALPGSDGGLVARLAAVDINLTSLDTLGTIAPVTQAQTTQITTGGAGTGGTPVQVQILNQAANQPDAQWLSIGHILYLAGAAGSLAAVRLVAGLLLALGPFFIAFLLFDATRGLFEGWVRVLVATALGALGVAIILGVELALVETWLADLVARRLASVPVPGVALQLLVTFLIFALALLAVLVGAAWVALGFRLPPVWRGAAARVRDGMRGDALRAAPLPAGATGHVPAEGRSRAAFVVDAVNAAQRREAPTPTALLAGTAGARDAAGAQVAASGAPSRRISATPGGRDTVVATYTPIGQSYRHHNRVSLSAGRRDRPK